MATDDPSATAMAVSAPLPPATSPPAEARRPRSPRSPAQQLSGGFRLMVKRWQQSIYSNGGILVDSQQRFWLILGWWHFQQSAWWIGQPRTRWQSGWFSDRMMVNGWQQSIRYFQEFTVNLMIHRHYFQEIGQELMIILSTCWWLLNCKILQDLMITISWKSITSNDSMTTTNANNQE